MKNFINSIFYPIYFQDKGYKEIKRIIYKKEYSSIFILTDNNTNIFCLPYLIKKIPIIKKFKVICIKSGEKEKNIKSCLYIWNKLNYWNADRNSLIINLGGGVINDIGGFTASLFKRGIQFINIPTTLLAMVDASLGGKNGIDLNKLKNEIGVFSYPKIIIIDDFFLKSLPERDIKSGIAEILKYGLIFDKYFWEKIKNFYFKKPLIWMDIIKDSNKIKNYIIEKDPYEKNGLRKILNFGHTIGHAIESYFINTKFHLLHGECIALGIIFESWISWKINNFPINELEEIINTISKIYSFKNINNINIDKLLIYLKHDKKNLNGKIRCVLLSKIGSSTYDNEISENLIKEGFKILKKNKNIYNIIND